MKFSRREVALFAAPVLVLTLALAPNRISNALYQRTPDRIVIVNSTPVAIAKLRLVMYGHPYHVFTIENIKPHGEAWRSFDHRWAEQLTNLWLGQRGCMIQIEGQMADGCRFGHAQFYSVEPIPERFNPLKLVVPVYTRGYEGAEFYPSSRSQNQSLWRDLGDALFRRPQEVPAAGQRLRY